VAKTLKAGNLKQIELITNPTGKYRDQTAVINLVTVSSSLPDGVAGEVYAQGGTNRTFSAGASVTSKINRFIYNLKYGFQQNDDKYGLRIRDSIVNYLDDRLYHLKGCSKELESYTTHSALLKASYDITPQDLIGINIEANLKQRDVLFDSDENYSNLSGVISRRYTTISSNAFENIRYNGGVNYQHTYKKKPGRLFTALYAFDTKNFHSHYNRTVTGITDWNDSFELTRNDLVNTEHTVAADFFNPYNAPHFLDQRLKW
jgi:hypothetical protein